jgi:hypothetical protein
MCHSATKERLAVWRMVTLLVEADSVSAMSAPQRTD